MSVDNITALAELEQRRDGHLAVPDGNGNHHGPIFKRASDVSSRTIKWAWKGRLALGYLTVQTGEEGLGKSVFTAWLTARATHGELEGVWREKPVDVLIVAGEDGDEDTWNPRLTLAGANLERVAYLDLRELPSEWNVCDGIHALRAAITETGAKLIVFDALLDHMPPAMGGENINSPTFVRSALGPLKQLVRELNVTAIISMHPPKARGATFRDLVQASQAFSAIPRIGLVVAWHPDDAEDDPGRRRVVVRGKGNIGRNPGAREFRVVGRELLHDDGEWQEREVVVDVQPSDVTLSRLVSRPAPADQAPLSKSEQAAEVMRDLLGDGDWHPAGPVLDALSDLGLGSSSVIDRAKRLAGVEKRQQEGVPHGGWEWCIPGQNPGQNPTPPISLAVDSDPRNGANPQCSRSESQNPRVGTVDSDNGRVFPCCCTDGGVARRDGSCSRCEGQVIAT